MHLLGHPALEGNAQCVFSMEAVQECMQALPGTKHVTLLPGAWHQRHLQALPYT